MKVALIADIHGNFAAMEAVIAALAREQADRVVCLGDVASMGPQPREVIARLRATTWSLVMGNADAELLRPDDVPESDENWRKFADIIRWCAAQLDDTDLAYIERFVSTLNVSLGEAGSLLCCHGSPRSNDDVVVATTPDDELEAMLQVAGQDANVVAGGHTHIRLLRSFRGREIINPGSVGLAYEFFPDGSVRVPPWAEFAVLSVTGDSVEVTFRRVPYDRDATVRAMMERRMPHAAWWAEDWR